MSLLGDIFYASLCTATVIYIGSYYEIKSIGANLNQAAAALAGSTSSAINAFPTKTAQGCSIDMYVAPNSSAHLVKDDDGVHFSYNYPRITAKVDRYNDGRTVAEVTAKSLLCTASHNYSASIGPDGGSIKAAQWGYLFYFLRTDRQMSAAEQREFGSVIHSISDVMAKVDCSQKLGDQDLWRSRLTFRRSLAPSSAVLH